MHAVTGGQLDEALEYVDDGHALLARDRNTLRTVEAALSHLGTAAPDTVVGARAPYSVGELARHLELNPATLRTWERAGVLTPRRDPRSRHRQYLAQDVRDAELAHLLRRGGLPLGTIATVLGELRNMRQPRSAGQDPGRVAARPHVPRNGPAVRRRSALHLPGRPGPTHENRLRLEARPHCHLVVR